jgi:hypothetical protein
VLSKFLPNIPAQTPILSHCIKPESHSPTHAIPDSGWSQNQFAHVQTSICIDEKNSRWTVWLMAAPNLIFRSHGKVTSWRNLNPSVMAIMMAMLEPSQHERTHVWYHSAFFRTLIALFPLELHQNFILVGSGCNNLLCFGAGTERQRDFLRRR